MDQRLALLERQTASLETRLAARTNFSAGSLADADRGLQVTARIDALERRLDSALSELGRIQRQSDTAVRQANQAQRDAMRAMDLARDAASRTR